MSEKVCGICDECNGSGEVLREGDHPNDPNAKTFKCGNCWKGRTICDGSCWACAPAEPDPSDLR